MPRSALTRAALPREREQEFWLPSLQGEGLGMRANHTLIQQRPLWFSEGSAIAH